MSRKPLLEILFPVALIAGGGWRTLWSATATVAFLVGLSALIFGSGIYGNFLHSLPVASHSSLTLGGEGWAKMQSIYSIGRLMGAGDSPAWIAQAVATLACAAAMAALWRSAAPYELKAAALTSAAMLSNPYVHV